MKQNIKRVLGLACLVLLSGCAAQASMPQRVEADGDVRVQARGIAHLGDQDTLAEVRQRAWRNAIQRAVARGARLYVESYRRSQFGSLTDDRVEQVVAGTLREIRVLDEGMAERRYFIDLEAVVSPEAIREALRRGREGRRAVAAPAAVAATGGGEPPPLKVCATGFDARTSARLERALRKMAAGRSPEPDHTAAGRTCYRVAPETAGADLIARLGSRMAAWGTVPFVIGRGSDPGTIELRFDGGFD